MKIFMMLRAFAPRARRIAISRFFFHDHHDQGRGDIEGCNQDNDTEHDEQPQFFKLQCRKKRTVNILPGTYDIRKGQFFGELPGNIRSIVVKVSLHLNTADQSLRIEETLCDLKRDVGVEAVHQTTLFFKNRHNLERLHLGDHSERSNRKERWNDIDGVADRDPEAGCGIQPDDDPGTVMSGSKQFLDRLTVQGQQFLIKYFVTLVDPFDADCRNIAPGKQHPFLGDIRGCGNDAGQIPGLGHQLSRIADPLAETLNKHVRHIAEYLLANTVGKTGHHRQNQNQCTDS